MSRVEATIAVRANAPTDSQWSDALGLVWENGVFVREQTFADVRARSEIP
jgi:hypothetical protein